ncbi:hypothetical protein M8J77_026321 [Diaphorina citri]|nr:hypothetical protein M8J77_026321 [Diaphorina citri]
MAVKLAAIVCFVYLAQFGSCLPAADPALDIPVQGLHNPNSISSTKEEMMENIYSDCVNKGSYSCLKLKLFTFVDKMLTKDNINLFEGVTVVKTLPITNNGDGAPRAMPVSGDVESMITSRLENFLSTHTLKIDLKGIDVMNALTRAGRSISDEEDEEDVEARGKHDIIKKNDQYNHSTQINDNTIINNMPHSYYNNRHRIGARKLFTCDRYNEIDYITRDEDVDKNVRNAKNVK